MKREQEPKTSPRDTANKLILLRQNVTQIIEDPKYASCPEEIQVLQSFISGEDASLGKVRSALRNIKEKSQSASS